MELFVVNQPGTSGMCIRSREAKPLPGFHDFKQAQAECDRLSKADRGRYAVEKVVVKDSAPAAASPRDRLQVAREKAHQALGEAFWADCGPLFERFPELESFNWMHFPPYHTDRRQHAPFAFVESPGINGYPSGDIEDEGEYPDPETGNRYPIPELERLRTLQLAVAKFLSECDEEELLDLFGDDCTATVHRDGRLESSPL